MSPESESGFLTQKELTAHINQVHNNITHFKCDECAFKSVQIQNLIFLPKINWVLTTHINQVHYNITHFKCDECAFQRAQNQTLLFLPKMNWVLTLMLMLDFVPSIRKLPNTRYCCWNVEFFPNPNISNIRQLFSTENTAENVFVVTLAETQCAIARSVDNNGRSKFGLSPSLPSFSTLRRAVPPFRRRLNFIVNHWRGGW